MAAYVVKLSAGQKALLRNEEPVLLPVGKGPAADSFWLTPAHQMVWIEWAVAESDAGREVHHLAMMESDHIMRDVEIVP